MSARARSMAPQPLVITRCATWATTGAITTYLKLPSLCHGHSVKGPGRVAMAMLLC
uniref:Uncharacterized protein n=1 Tax=Arundo donax TaxID=35708 RepID=A0A0A9E4Q1_ARUDO